MSPEPNISPTSPPPLPSVGRVALPLWLMVLAVVLGWRGCVYLDDHAGGLGFSPYLSGPFVSTNELAAVLQLIVNKDDPLAAGKAVYDVNCVLCHQPDGNGAPGQFPPLRGSEWVLADGPNRMIRIISNGLNGPVSVKGQLYNGAMPAFSHLTDAEMAAVITFIRGNPNWGHEASPVTVEQVSAVRGGIAGRPNAWTSAELEQVPVN